MLPDTVEKPAYCCEFLGIKSDRNREIKAISEWKTFRAESKTKRWVYLYSFDEHIAAWGTTSQGSDRVRKSSLFDCKLTGKYDRRVDYLMLKEIYGTPRFWIFESQSAAELEGRLRQRFEQKHCYVGFKESSREEISKFIYGEFKNTPHFRSLTRDDAAYFDRYMLEVFFRHPRHPKNPKRTFFWGDSLETKFLRAIGRQELEPAIERALKVRF
jgi:hypothetical protein